MSTELKDLKCPACNSDLRPGNLFTACANWKRDDPNACWFRVWHKMNEKPISPENIADLIQKGRTPVLTGFVSKAGRKFDAAIVLNPKDRKVDYEFHTNKTTLELKCPACGSPVIQDGRVFRCEKHDHKDREHTCWFSQWSETQGHTFTIQDITDLVKQGKTKVYELTSQKAGSKKYQGRLVLDLPGKQIKVLAESTPKPQSNGSEPAAETPTTPAPEHAGEPAGIAAAQEEEAL